MRFAQKRLALIAATIVSILIVHPSVAQQTAQSAGTRPSATTTQAGEIRGTGSFPVHVTLGPALVLPTTKVSYSKTGQASEVNPFSVEGIAWDGVNNGLWVMLLDGSGQLTDGSSDRKCVAMLIDPVTGQEKKRLDMPAAAQLVGHDGVGLWIGDTRLRRIRTAPDPLPSREGLTRQLPEDLGESNTEVFRTTATVPSPNLYEVFRTAGDGGQIGAVALLRYDLDHQIATLYGKFGAGWPLSVTTGAGYLWLRWPSLERIPLHTLKPVNCDATDLRGLVHSPEAPTHGLREKAIADKDDPTFNGPLAWDGQHLWSISSQVYHSRSVAPPKRLSPSVNLVKIDVGFTRHADTDARYKKALAFEQANGTLKALPIFEQIFTDDPSAVEIRNHVGWALATRANEPYHNIDRALELVNQALEWQPWNPEMWDTLAEIYWRKGDAKLAEHLEAKAINLNPNKRFYWRQYEKFRAGPATQPAPEPNYN